MTTLKIYAVLADRDTGEWLDVPLNTGDTEDDSIWSDHEDTQTLHFDTYEMDDETRAIVVHLV